MLQSTTWAVRRHRLFFGKSRRKNDNQKGKNIVKQCRGKEKKKHAGHIRFAQEDEKRSDRNESVSTQEKVQRVIAGRYFFAGKGETERKMGG